jgi:hypothetical protein
MQNSYNPEPTDEWSLQPHFCTVRFNIVFYFGRTSSACSRVFERNFCLPLSIFSPMLSTCLTQPALFDYTTIKYLARCTNHEALNNIFF